jgi:NADH-quinone oxidoreductase subunit E
MRPAAAGAPAPAQRSAPAATPAGTGRPARPLSGPASRPARPAGARARGAQSAQSAKSAKPAATGPRKPRALKAARKAGADDLKQIKGIGPKLETTLNGLGIFHFDQIAKWSADNVAWVDEQLNFRGRIDREKWVAQAEKLAGG